MNTTLIGNNKYEIFYLMICYKLFNMPQPSYEPNQQEGYGRLNLGLRVY